MNPHHPLQYALEFLVGTTDAWKAAKTPKVKVPRRLSLKTVLSAVEADASLPDMEQPAGLNGIKLHLYQRCAATGCFSVSFSPNNPEFLG